MFIIYGSMIKGFIATMFKEDLAKYPGATIKEFDSVSAMSAYVKVMTANHNSHVTEPTPTTPPTIVIPSDIDDAERIRRWTEEYNKLDYNDRWLIQTVLVGLEKMPIEKRKSPTHLLAIAIDKCINAGFKRVCPRCNGTGHYSYNPIDGTICYGCMGRKYKVPILTPENKAKIMDHFRPRIKIDEPIITDEVV